MSFSSNLEPYKRRSMSPPRCQVHVFLLFESLHALCFKSFPFHRFSLWLISAAALERMRRLKVKLLFISRRDVCMLPLFSSSLFFVELSPPPMTLIANNIISLFIKAKRRMSRRCELTAAQAVRTRDALEFAVIILVAARQTNKQINKSARWS